MECKPSDSKKLCKVFEASKKSRRKKNGVEDSSESDCSKSVPVVNKTSKPALEAEAAVRHVLEKKHSSAGSSSGVSPPRAARRSAPRTPHSPRRRGKGGNSLALKPGFASTPRSESPDNTPRSVPQQEVAGEGGAAADRDSCIYDFLEDALKKKKHKHHSRKHESKSPAESVRGRDSHRHRKHSRKDLPASINQELLETFVKMYSQKKPKDLPATEQSPAAIPRTKSNKSLQCEYLNEYSDIDRHPTRLRKGMSPTDLPRGRVYSRDGLCESGTIVNEPHASRRDPDGLNTGRYTDPQRRSQLVEPRSTRSRDHLEPRIYDERPSKERFYERELRTKYYDDRSCKDKYVDEDGRQTREEKLSRNYDDRYVDRRRRYEDRDRFDRDCVPRYSPRRKPDRKNCALCRDSDTRADRRAYEERDSVASVADAADSLVSANGESERFESPAHQTRSKACKESVMIDPAIQQQEVAEQRQALDKMMKLWQELMARFKDVTENMGRSERAVQDTAAAARESAATQLQLWRECMQRYDTVARDVGDTDARLMEELLRQKAEMSEMSSAWQECLAQYKEMSSHLTTIKQQMSAPVSPPAPPPLAPAGEGAVPPHGYMMPPPPHAAAAYPMMYGGSPMRARVSAPGALPPAAWWWGGGGGGGGGPRSPPPPPPRRAPSLDSRSDGSRERRPRRHHAARDSHRDNRRDKDRSSSKAHVSRSDRRRKK